MSIVDVVQFSAVGEGFYTGAITGYLLFVLGTVGGAILLAWTAGQGSAYLTQRVVGGEEGDWWGNRLPAGDARYLRFWISVVAWLALVAGYFYFYDLRWVALMGICVSIVAGVALVSIPRRRSTAMAPRTVTVLEILRRNSIVATGLGLYYFLVGMVVWIQLQILVFTLPAGIVESLFTQFAFVALLFHVPLVLSGVIFFSPWLVPGWLWNATERGPEWVADEVAMIRNDAERRAIEELRTHASRVMDWIIDGIAILAVIALIGIFLLIVLLDRPVSVLVSPEAVTFSIFLIVQLSMIGVTLWGLVLIHRADFSDTTVRKLLLRSGARTFARIPIVFAVAVGMLLALEAVFHVQIRLLEPNITALFTPQGWELLETSYPQPEEFLETAQMIDWGEVHARFWQEDIQLLFFVGLPLFLLFVFTPPIVSYLYFSSTRDLATVGVVIVAFAMLTIVVQAVLTGGVIRLRNVGLGTVLPAIVAEALVGVAKRYQTVWQYIDCPSCDEQVDPDASVCPYCGTTVVECDYCGAMMAGDDRMCERCGRMP